MYRYKIKVTKLNELKFISHLDWQNLIIKTFRRMGLKLALSQGFNPKPKISFSPALPIFIESECEFIYFETTEPALNFEENFKNAVSENVKLVQITELHYEQKKPQPLETMLQWAQYEAILNKNISGGIFKIEDLKYNLKKCLLNDNLFIKKIDKKGFEKNVDYKNSLKSIEMEGEKIIFTLKTGQGAVAPALRADDFLRKVFGEDVLFEIKRTKFFNEDFKEV